jgi:hypothetical protein
MLWIHNTCINGWENLLKVLRLSIYIYIYIYIYIERERERERERESDRDTYQDFCNNSTIIFFYKNDKSKIDQLSIST